MRRRLKVYNWARKKLGITPAEASPNWLRKVFVALCPELWYDRNFDPATGRYCIMGKEISLFTMQHLVKPTEEGVWFRVKEEKGLLYLDCKFIENKTTNNKNTDG